MSTGTVPLIDWGLFWQILGIYAAVFVPVYVLLYLARKRINRWTAGLWARPWAAWHARHLTGSRSRKAAIR